MALLKRRGLWLVDFYVPRQLKIILHDYFVVSVDVRDDPHSICALRLACLLTISFISASPMNSRRIVVSLDARAGRPRRAISLNGLNRDPVGFIKIREVIPDRVPT